MEVEIVIDGRKALPVRSIPFITGWMMSPDMVASALAKTDHIQHLEKVCSYHLLSDGSFALMLPKEWDGIEKDLQILSDRLKAKEEIDNESYTEWRRQSVPLLPPGVFVWKDEFEKSFSLVYDPMCMAILDERPGDRELNFSPFIPSELRTVIAEGFAFPQVRSEPQNADKPMTTTERNSLLTVIAALCDYSAIDPAGRGTAGQIAKMSEEIGAPVTDDTIRKILAKIPDALENRKK